MVGNDFYDPSTGTRFVSGPAPESQEPRFWSRAEPIWVAAEKQGRRAAMFWWDGCSVNITGVTGSYCVPYDIDAQYHIWSTDMVGQRLIA